MAVRGKGALRDGCRAQSRDGMLLSYRGRTGGIPVAELSETQGRHANDVMTGNMAGLMGDFTPNAMARAGAIAANPITAASYEVKDLGNNEAEISYIGDKTRVIWSKWVDSDGKWQIDDLAER
jgi:hypothetical protein